MDAMGAAWQFWSAYRRPSRRPWNRSECARGWSPERGRPLRCASGGRMNAVSLDRTYVMAERFDKALKALREALAEVELEIAGEFDGAGVSGMRQGGARSRSR